MYKYQIVNVSYICVQSSGCWVLVFVAGGAALPHPALHQLCVVLRESFVGPGGAQRPGVSRGRRRTRSSFENREGYALVANGKYVAHGRIGG